jgi:hypothetical protein
MGNPQLPIRKPAQVNVQPNGAVPANAQSGILPSHQSAAPFGSVSRESALPIQGPSVSPQGVPINDKDAGHGTGNVRSGGANKGGVGLWAGGAD